MDPVKPLGSLESLAKLLKNRNLNAICIFTRADTSPCIIAMYHPHRQHRGGIVGDMVGDIVRATSCPFAMKGVQKSSGSAHLDGEWIHKENRGEALV